RASAPSPLPVRRHTLSKVIDAPSSTVEFNGISRRSPALTRNCWLRSSRTAYMASTVPGPDGRRSSVARRPPASSLDAEARGNRDLGRLAVGRHEAVVHHLDRVARLPLEDDRLPGGLLEVEDRPALVVDEVVVDGRRDE